jgi:hypothetical protein
MHSIFPDFLGDNDDFLNIRCSEVREGALAVAVDQEGRIAAAGDQTEVTLTQFSPELYKY